MSALGLTQFLAGVWRSDPPSVKIAAAELDAIAPFLLASGAGSLGWWRIRQTALAGTPAALELQQAYWLHAIQAAIHQSHLEESVKLLNQAHIEALLVKGWSVARLYPRAGLRPYGDLDLCVRNHDFERAKAILASRGKSSWCIDLHQEVADLKDRSPADLWQRTSVARINQACFYVLGSEDRLRHMRLHLMRHGAWRPLWLCDIGAALEATADSFDWDYFLQGERRWTEWALCAIGLANELLQARVPPAIRPLVEAVPHWMVDTVLGEWSSARPGDSHTRDRQPFRSYWQRPWQAWHGLSGRWPNPIEAGVKAGRSPGAFLTGLPSQLALFLRRALRFAGRRSCRPGLCVPRCFSVHEE